MCRVFYSIKYKLCFGFWCVLFLVMLFKTGGVRLSEEMDEIEIDQRCEGQWSDGKWYHCTVVEIQNGKYEVEWADGDTRFCSLSREQLKPIFDDYVQCDKCNGWRELREGMPRPGPDEAFLCENVGVKCLRIKKQARVKIHPAGRQKSKVFHKVLMRYPPNYKERQQASFREDRIESRNAQKKSKDCDSKAPMEEEDMDEEDVQDENVQESPDEGPSGAIGEVQTNKKEVYDLTNDSDDPERPAEVHGPMKKPEVVDLTCDSD